LSLVVILPLEPGEQERARARLAGEPPVESATEAYVTEQEVVFLLGTGADVDRIVTEWSDLAAGPPRIAESVYSWLLPQLTDEAFVTATPGPGDSEGGDVYYPEAP
jgi:hypothetical protein